MRKSYALAGAAAATGDIRYPLTLDVELHSLTQRNHNILKGLIAALLDLDTTEIDELTLLNPIDYRDAFDKEIILDMRVSLNNSQLINVELQLYFPANKNWWINRSLLYLCRLFDNLESGDNYEKIRPSTQISIVDKDFLEDSPAEFYSHYRLTNERNGFCYSSNFSLNVLYLNHIDLADEEDFRSGLVYWARLFKARTWEGLKNLVREYPEIKEVAERMFDYNIDPAEKTIAEGRVKYLAVKHQLIRERDDAVHKLDETEQKLDKAIQERDSLAIQLEQAQRTIAELEAKSS